MLGRIKKALTPLQRIFSREKWPLPTTLKKLSGTCTGAGGKERHGEMFSAKGQRMLIYLSVKLPLGRRRWARRSRRRSSRVGTRTESAPGSAHTCLCSCRETCCTDPRVTAGGKKKPTGNVGETALREQAQGAKKRSSVILVPCGTGKSRMFPKHKPGTLLTVSYA